MIVQVWSSDLESAITCCLHGSAVDWLVGEDAILLYQIQAPTWTDAMQEHHRRQGWEPYIPEEGDETK